MRRISWSPLPWMPREGTQGRPEVPAPAAPPRSARPSRRLPGAIPRTCRASAGRCGQMLQFGHVLGDGLGELARGGHVVLGHPGRVRDGHRHPGGRVVNRQDRRGVAVGMAADVGAAGQPDERLDLGHAVLAEPDRRGGRGHAVTS